MQGLAFVHSFQEMPERCDPKKKKKEVSKKKEDIKSEKQKIQRISEMKMFSAFF